MHCSNLLSLLASLMQSDVIPRFGVVLIVSSYEKITKMRNEALSPLIIKYYNDLLGFHSFLVFHQKRMKYNLNMYLHADSFFTSSLKSDHPFRENYLTDNSD